ncbi:L-amino acid N-acyltransferase YncA [Marininema mesophilum]|uniref:L-amino acid N-acyltransferase YncA n=1 Tax=Marininema mesophilum TaxID=1048340 RepID=A0A1H2XAU1_9BACL|nr:GNAT family N-acetyltransferase [Marininema mesophilum]SDW89925.1 L-amino acid N-acyltransferase YncA [Marininema mesophilum]
MIIRKATIDDTSNIAKVQVESWRSTYSGFIPADYLDSLSLSEKEALWHKVISANKSSTYVVEIPSHQVIGFVNGGPEQTGAFPYSHELYAIYILKEYQQQGLGIRLFQELAKDGIHSFVVWVLAQNPSREFYKYLGGRKIATEMVTIGGVNLEEVAYGITLTKMK